MKKKFSVFLVCLFCLMLPLTFIGCGEAEVDSNVIRVNEVTHSIFYAPFYVAMTEGYFDDADITIELTNGGGSDNVMTALTTGTADIGLMGPESTIYLDIAGADDHAVVFGQLTKRDGSFIVAREADPDFTFADLKGKHVIAGRVGGMPAMTLEYVINQAGVETDELTFDTSIEFANMAGAFLGDSKYDYVSLFEPTASALVAEGQGYIVGAIGSASGEVPYTAFSAKPSYLEENADKAEAFLTAVVKGYNFIVDNYDNLGVVAESISAQFDGTSLTDIETALKSYVDIDAWSSSPVMSEQAFERLQDIMENADQLDERADFDSVIDNTIANKVMDAMK